MLTRDQTAELFRSLDPLATKAELESYQEQLAVGPSDSGCVGFLDLCAFWARASQSKDQLSRLLLPKRPLNQSVVEVGQQPLPTQMLLVAPTGPF